MQSYHRMKNKRRGGGRDRVKKKKNAAESSGLAIVGAGRQTATTTQPSFKPVFLSTRPIKP